MKQLKLWWKKYRIKCDICNMGSNRFYESTGSGHYRPCNRCVPKNDLWRGTKVTDFHECYKKYLGRGSSSGPRPEHRYDIRFVISFENEKEGWGIKSHYQQDWWGVTHIGFYEYELNSKTLT